MTPIVRIRGLGKYFGPSLVMDGETQPREALQTLLRIAGFRLEGGSRERAQTSLPRSEYILRDIDLDIEPGSVVCVTGLFRSGKTVFLQLLGGVLPPTAGRIEIFAPVTTLLSIGGILDQRMTARQNIAANREAAADSPEEVARFTAEAIAFAGIEGFEDAPLRTFSTGMVLRLSVALALCGRPSLVLIDDVMEVGDIAFRQRCVDRLYELKEQGCTLIAVLTDENLVRQIATRVLTLGGGRIVGDATPLQWLKRHAGGTAEVEWQVQQPRIEDAVIVLTSVTVDAVRDGARRFLDVAMRCESKKAGLRCRPFIVVFGRRVTLFRSLYPEFLPVAVPSTLTFTVRVPIDILPPGDYAIGTAVTTLHAGTVYVLRADEAVKVVIRHPGADEVAGARPAAALAVDLPWEVEPVGEVVPSQ